MPGLDPAADLEKLRKRISNVQSAGTGYSGRCPAHDDKTNSLSFGVRNNRVYWHCHAGCSQEAVYEAFVAAGILERPQKRAVNNGHRQFKVHDGGKSSKGGTANAKVIATYDYVDLTGQLVHQTVKFEGKQFRQRRPNADGGWTWKLDGVNSILYRLSDVVGADTVFIVEGEKDVENLRAIGLVATTNAMGAGKWHDRYSQALIDKHVVILPDNDETGRKHATKVATSVFAAGAKSVRVVHLDGLPEHGDVSDWLEHGHDRDELERLVRQTNPWAVGAGGDPAWRTKLIKGERSPVGNEANVEIALRHCPELVGRLRFDEFRTQLQCRDLPWDKSGEWRDWVDRDDINLAIYVQREEINIPPHRVSPVAESVGRLSGFHPVREYLDGLKWDGVKRVDKLFLEYAKCRHSNDAQRAYLMAIAICMMISAVARIMQPGCKVDTLVVMEGPQGIGKSTFARVLFGSDWFTDQIADFSTKDYAIDLRGKWCVELAELVVLSKSDERVVKSVVSRQTDHYRPPYGRRSIDVDRQNIFFASTNRQDYLGDETGNRRFNPAAAVAVDVAAVKRDRDQLWAEAVQLYREGVPWHLTGSEEETAREEQASRTDEEVWSPWIDSYLRTLGKDYVQTGDILISLGLDKAHMDKKAEMRVAKHLKHRGWERTKRRIDGVPAYVYLRPSGKK